MFYNASYGGHREICELAKEWSVTG
jgi:hypothetical protein